MAAFIIGKANEKSINGEENGIIFNKSIYNTMK